MIRTIVPILSLTLMAGAYGGYRYTRASAATTSPEAATATIAYQPRDIREQSAVWLLAAIGNEQPSRAIVVAVVEWSLFEDHGNDAISRNNLWNTTMCGYNMLGSINDDGACGVQAYKTPADGIAATAATLAQGNFKAVADALRANDVDGFKRALWESGWAASHYNYGVGWPAYQPQSGTRAALVAYALTLQGIPYVSGGRNASGGDCSGTMQHIYLTVAGIDIGATTFSQYPNLQPIDLAQVQPGDLWYGQYSNDQHTGMIADVDNDGRWDLINNGGLSNNMHVDYDFLSMEYFNQHTMGFRSALAGS
jgi:cell wall-associated NlpC family hydrolase